MDNNSLREAESGGSHCVQACFNVSFSLRLLRLIFFFFFFVTIFHRNIILKEPDIFPLLLQLSQCSEALCFSLPAFGRSL